MGITGEFGYGKFSGSFFHSLPEDLDPSYFGVTIARTIWGNSSNATLFGGIIWAGELGTINYPSSAYSIALASAWVAASSTLFPGGTNLITSGTSGALASFWSYFKWHDPETLAKRQVKK
jgi:hypothetical protein